MNLHEYQAKQLFAEYGLPVSQGVAAATSDEAVAAAQPYQGRELAFKLGLNPTQVKQFTKIFLGLAKMFEDFDFALLEINPLVITNEGNLHCLDGKINIDGNALYRQPKIREMHDPSQEDEREALVQLKKWVLKCRLLFVWKALMLLKVRKY